MMRPTSGTVAEKMHNKATTTERRVPHHALGCIRKLRSRLVQLKLFVPIAARFGRVSPRPSMLTVDCRVVVISDGSLIIILSDEQCFRNTSHSVIGLHTVPSDPLGLCRFDPKARNLGSRNLRYIMLKDIETRDSRVVVSVAASIEQWTQIPRLTHPGIRSVDSS